MKPRMLEWTAPLRSTNYFEPSWMSLTFALRLIDGYFQTVNDAGYYLKDAAVNARSPDNEADEYEKAFLEALNSDRELVSRSADRIIGGESWFVVLRKSEVVEESCLLCHGNPADAPGDLVRIDGPERSFHRRVGEVMSVISLRVPLSRTYAEADRLSWQLIGLLVAILCLLSLTQFWLTKRFLLSPLSTIREKAIEISTDETHLGETIPEPFGRELGDLISAFNSMSAGLRTAKDRLELRITERTVTIASANESLTREIAVRRQVEENLKKERDFAESLVEIAQAIILVLDSEGRIVRFNSYLEQLSGYRMEDAKGADWFSTFIPERDRSRIRALFAQAISGIPTRGNVNPIVAKDGREYSIEWYDTTPKGADGTPAGLLSIGQDVTERLRAEEERLNLERQLQHSQKVESLGVMAGGIAHDFNNLLMVVLGNVDIVMQRLPPDSPARPQVEAIGKAAVKAANLTNEMLAFSGKGSFIVRNIDLSQTIDEMVGILTVSIPKKVRIEKRLARGLPAIEADVAQMQQVVWQRFSTRSTRRSLRGADSASRWCWGSCGSRRGPSWLNRPRVRGQPSRFSSLHRPKRRRGRPMAEIPGMARGGKGTGTVLLVDDDETVVAVVRLMLEEMGYAVLVASNGRTAVETYKKHSHEIGSVLLDLTMPDMDGGEVFEKIRKIRSEARVILSSGHSETELRKQFSGKGIAGFIQKPYRYERLASVMTGTAR